MVRTINKNFRIHPKLWDAFEKKSGDICTPSDAIRELISAYVNGRILIKRPDTHPMFESFERIYNDD